MNSEEVSFFAAYKDHLVVVAWLLVVVGWFLNNSQSNLREKRKETRSEIDAICKKASELADSCREYYTKPVDPQNDVSESSKIAFEVYRIVSRVERLNGRVKRCDGSPFEKSVKCCGVFFEAITSDPFKSSTREKLAPDSDFILNIEESTHGLMDSLEDGFSLAFK
ncbi:hypothetical protein [Comamonas sp. lk]|uniref:hypothetical protein n=1 Tax=Comamonas sp. lk TaxID=2201272 RepID=UPI0013CEA312|nr:hypothetical protein [Comamonas sp. lk]